MSVQASDGQLERLTEEVRLLRAELAAVRSAQEDQEQREARLRASRTKAVKAADVLAQTLAERLRIEAAATSSRGGLLRRRTGAPTPEEQQQLELIRSSSLFDAGWYLRHHLDVVRSGQEPALHFLRNPMQPMRQPGPDFDTAQYYDDHPELLDSDTNPLVHFLSSPESVGADRYPPED
jgi:hypothetical protein